MKLIDLSHPLDAHTPTYPGDPAPELERLARVETDGYTLHRLSTVLHVGTHIDAPAHMVPGGETMADVAVERLVGRGVLVDARGLAEVGDGVLAGTEIRVGDIVLVLTGHAARWREPDYFTDYPVLGESFAQCLAEGGVTVLGLDTPSPDQPPFPVHKSLLGQGVLIAENLTGLERLLDAPAFEVWALPAAVRADGAPARIVARIG